MISLSIPKRTRGILIGQSGSGKTTLALELCNTMPKPLIVIDTKWSDGIGKWANKNEIDIVTVFPDIKKMKKNSIDEIVWRPDADLLSDPQAIDSYLDELVRSHEICSVYIDELYQLHRNGRAGPGLVGLYTRGREMGFTTLSGSQRPAWISPFCLTESDQYYVMRLLMRDDRKKVAEMMGAPEITAEILEERWFWYAKQGDTPVLVRPIKIGSKPLTTQENSDSLKNNGYTLI